MEPTTSTESTEKVLATPERRASSKGGVINYANPTKVSSKEGSPIHGAVKIDEMKQVAVPKPFKL
jgi:hypothetical protein